MPINKRCFFEPDIAAELTDEDIFVKAQNWPKPIVDTYIFATLFGMFFVVNAKTIGAGLGALLQVLSFDELFQLFHVLAVGFQPLAGNLHQACEK